MDKLHSLIHTYMKFVLLHDLNDDGKNWSEFVNKPEFEEYLETRIFENSVCSVFDIVDWYEGTGDYAENGHYRCGRQGSVCNLMDATTICEAIQIIAGEYALDYRYIIPEIVLRNYTHVYVSNITVSGFKSILA